jgi:hypothetical protein
LATFAAPLRKPITLFVRPSHLVKKGRTLMNQLAHNIVQEHDDLAEVIKARAEVALSALRGLPDEMRKQVVETALRDLPNSKLKITLGN